MTQAAPSFDRDAHLRAIAFFIRAYNTLPRSDDMIVPVSGLTGDVSVKMKAVKAHVALFVSRLDAGDLWHAEIRHAGFVKPIELFATAEAMPERVVTEIETAISVGAIIVEAPAT